MIAGTLVVEDLTLQFRVVRREVNEVVLDAGHAVVYTVCDNPTGEEETKTVEAKHFMVALGIALSFDGDVPESREAAWDVAESVQPESANLRFIP